MRIGHTFLWQWILAVIVSVALWVVSMSDKPFEVTEKLPVTIPELPADFILLSGNRQDSVLITFTGQGIGVLRDQIFRRPEMIRLDLPILDHEQVYPMIRFLELVEGDVQFNGNRYSNLSAISFIPHTITVTIDRRISRNLPVTVTSTGSVPARYFLSMISNYHVQVTGAESVVTLLDSCDTAPIRPDSGYSRTAIERPDGVMSIIPSSVTAELIPPVRVIAQAE